MSVRKLRTTERTLNQKVVEDFPVVNDTKLKMSLIGLADRYNEFAREIILKTYNDMNLMSLYRGIRSSGVYQHGSKSKVHRKILEFPNPYVYDFVDTTMTALYGEEWLSDRRALRHELVRPWHVVNNL